MAVEPVQVIRAFTTDQGIHPPLPAISTINDTNVFVILLDSSLEWLIVKQA